MLNFLLFFGDLEAESGINTAQREESQGGGCLGIRGRMRNEGGKGGKACGISSGKKSSPAGLWEACTCWQILVLHMIICMSCAHLRVQCKVKI